jgi:hypothetical protein
MANDKLNVGLIQLSIDRLERIVQNFDYLLPTLDHENVATAELVDDIEAIRDHIEYHKELNRDIPRIPKTF